MTALLMALILCVGMVSGTNKEVRAQSASQNSEMQAASESDVTTENTANIAENTTKSAATVTHHEYTTEEVKETIQGIFEWAKSLTNADELIDKTFLEGADTSLNDWFAFAAARSGYKEDYKSYRKAMETAIAKKYGTKKEKLGKATEYQRAALVIAALGGDPQAVSDMAGEKTINLIADGTYNRGKTEPLDTQGTNALIWALIALDSGNYEVPKRTDAYPYGTLTPEETDRQNSRQKMINFILANQFDDGGWNLQPKDNGGSGYNAVSDVDMTGMAMIALAPYMKQAKVKKAIDRAITYLSKQQKADGGFGSWGTVNSESCAQAICGLLVCGVNPNTDKRFIKNGKSIIDGLMSFYDEKVGGFRHVNTASGGYEAVVNQMATEQAYYALAQLYKTVPTKAALSKAVKAGSGKIKLSWKKAAVNTDYVTKKSGKTAEVSGYQIVCATDKKFSKNVKRVTVSGSKTLTKTVTNLKKGKTYYVKVRAYKTVNGKKLYGAYSAVKRVQC